MFYIVLTDYGFYTLLVTLFYSSAPQKQTQICHFIFQWAFRNLKSSEESFGYDNSFVYGLIEFLLVFL